MQCLFLIVVFCKVPLLWALLGLLSCKSDACRRCTCTNVLLVFEGEVGELVQPGGIWGLPWGLLCATSGRKDLCIVSCHSCRIYRIWTSRSKKVWGCLKAINWGLHASHKRGGGGSFHREGRFSLCNTAVLWNFIASLTGSVILHVWVWQSQKCNSRYPNEKVKWLFQKNVQVFYFTPENSLSCLYCNFWLQPSFW